MLQISDPYQISGNVQYECLVRVKLKDRQANFLLCTRRCGRQSLFQGIMFTC